MNRRFFLRRAAAAAAASCITPRSLLAENGNPPLQATLTVDRSANLATVPADFLGLSYESAQLANPAFFTAENTALIALFRDLSHDGVLRLGGGTSDFTRFTTTEPGGPPPFDAVGPDTSKNVKTDTPVTPKSLQNLRAFLDAANWRCLYGLNLARAPIPLIVEEATYAQRILGPRLIAFQLGNEPDAWRNRYRPANWTYADYWNEWAAAHSAIVQQIPQAKFAGPDVSNKMAYVTGFAEDIKKSNLHDVILLTSHYYAMGPAGAQGISIDRLLSPDPKLDRDLEIAVTAARSDGIPYRMTEGNSCWNGGQPGVSDTLASALWVADVMLNFASMGCSGVNLHGGGFGYYTPIAGDLEKGFLRRPEFFGMEIAAPFAGATIEQSTLSCSNTRVRAYAGRKAGARLLLTINKTDQLVTMQSPMQRAKEQWTLSGPAIDAKEGVKLTKSRPSTLHHGLLHLQPFTAVLMME